MTSGADGRSLLQGAWEVLREGPLATPELARCVLGLNGHAGAAAAAVFALLGGDDRFEVDGEGVWSLRGGSSRPGALLSRLSYAVVDVETTGGRYEGGHRMTEVAVVEVGGRNMEILFDHRLRDIDTGHNPSPHQFHPHSSDSHMSNR